MELVPWKSPIISFACCFIFLKNMELCLHGACALEISHYFYFFLSNKNILKKKRKGMSGSPIVSDVIISQTCSQT
jgi:hypothetical protein